MAFDYEFRYQVTRAPEARNDGTGYVAWDTLAVSRVVGTTTFIEVPGRHTTTMLPASGIKTALASGTNAQKVTALKNLMRDNLYTQPVPVVAPNDWTEAGLELYMDANDLSLEQATALDAFIHVVAPNAYPVTFAL